MLNSLVSGRRLALRVSMWQLAVSVLVGFAFLARGRQEALAAAAGGGLVALGTALMAARVFSSWNGGMAFARLLAGMLLKWIVVLGGLAAILIRCRLSPPAVIIGLLASCTVNLLALRWEDRGEDG